MGHMRLLLALVALASLGACKHKEREHEPSGFRPKMESVAECRAYCQERGYGMRVNYSNITGECWCTPRQR